MLVIDNPTSTNARWPSSERISRAEGIFWLSVNYLLSLLLATKIKSLLLMEFKRMVFKIISSISILRVGLNYLFSSGARPKKLNSSL